MKDSFNSNFYITTAAVAPLLYITLFLQGQTVQNLSRRTARRVFEFYFRILYWSRDENKGKLWLKKSLMILATLIISPVLGAIITIFVLTAFAGVVAEGLSLWALYYQSDNVTIRAIVLWSMLGLLALVCANPIITILRNFYGSESNKSDEKPDSAEGGNEK